MAKGQSQQKECPVFEKEYDEVFIPNRK